MENKSYQWTHHLTARRGPQVGELHQEPGRDDPANASCPRDLPNMAPVRRPQQVKEAGLKLGEGMAYS